MSSPTALFIIDPPERLDPPTDTSLALMRECVTRGYQVWWTTLKGLSLRDQTPLARAYPVSFAAGAEMFLPSAAEDMHAAGTDLVFMRKDPPLDLAYLHATLVLDRLGERTIHINPPQALRNYCEKLIPSLFAELFPPSLVSSDPELLLDFLDRHRHIVIKPLEDCSGKGVYVLRCGDPNARPLITTLTLEGNRYLQGQKFLPEISLGDKRVLLLAGEIIGWIRRVPATGDFRSNVNAGGHCEPCELTEGDRRICATVGQWLKREGIVLAGIDIVGEYLLEVNITSPSCLREINELTGRRLEVRILDHLEEELRGAR
ncbi:glutathione synthase [Geoalkalibacter halelectricus]|uniref:Glutathione synthetase n=1 Tax=Geoalkalibacter halelectricus TaxID=2847045 RepID=A0ABY5ZM04_9BACT|nr:glutathione synthase [Geoalkalibacter halelectricus]MDO3380150.1 glutathione synthase [Geoalkalibacter halelectricus]UWZ78276.1 glutathione synthase [Geoalkalibacter halelectricus]